MAAAVAAVHQTRLRGGGDLVEDGPHGLLGGRCCIQRRQGVGEDRRGLLLQLGHRMDPAAAADLGRAAADQALPAFQMQLLPVHLPAVGAQHIHIIEPSQRGGILDIGGQLLDGQRVGVQHIERLAAGGAAAGLLMQGRQPRPEKLLPQQLLSPGKAPADQGRVLDRAADIHSKADQRPVILFQKHPLALHPALPGIQHLHQRNFRRHNRFSFQRFFFSAFMNSCTCGRRAASLWQKI